eukprot:GCRY01004576.1.p1 GENE.GCRY01004576.1~~GCRY01004576.1.p1  ORF type:complete len:166 (-),score=28.12 GCRY01004576.1:364-789(-)
MSEEGKYSILLFYESQFESTKNVFLHHETKDGEWKSKKLQLIDSWYYYKSKEKQLQFVFHDDEEKNWDNNEGRNYLINCPGVYYVKNGSLSRCDDLKVTKDSQSKLDLSRLTDDSEQLSVLIKPQLQLKKENLLLKNGCQD